MQKQEFSLWSLRVLVATGLQGALMSKMRGWIDRMLLEAMFPSRFPTVGLFQPKNGPKGNFQWKNGEVSLWSLRVLVSTGLQGAVISKMTGRIDRMLLKAMSLNRFPIVVLFQPKNGRKLNFLWKKGNFLCGVCVFLF